MTELEESILDSIEPVQDLEDVVAALNIAREHGLEAEVVWMAMVILKNSPEMSIKEALYHGLCEWDL